MLGPAAAAAAAAVVAWLLLTCTAALDGEAEEPAAAIRQCYGSPADLFQVYPQLNGTFKIKIKNECLQLPSLELNLYAVDVSIADQIFQDVDHLEPGKVNVVKVNRPVMVFGPAELNNFQPQSRFKLALVFSDHTGVVNVALHPKTFQFWTGFAGGTGSAGSSTTEIVLVVALAVLLVITCLLLALLIYVNYCVGSRRRPSAGMVWWRPRRHHRASASARVGLLQKQHSAEPGEVVQFEPRSNPIPVDKIVSMIPELLNEDRIRAEYESVPKSKLSSWNDGRLPEHKTKNRYGNLLPYDHTRVVLKDDGPEASGNYINANFIDGYRRPRRYIAMQGPIEGTVHDFWRCVWQYRCQQVVMLTNLEEGGRVKCEKYWPDVSRVYGRIKVTLQNRELYADCIVRSFLCERDGTHLFVVQYHFISWPDHNVPSYACTLISFMNRVRSSPLYKEPGQMVVHCSAGIGRTGAFILIDSMLEMARKEKRIDVLGHFCRIRQQRINMVEKLSQYVFVYHVLVEALSHESSNIGCPEFEAYLEAVSKGARLHKQFEILNLMSLWKLPSHVCKFGLLYAKLNRRSDVVPPDYARVILPNHEDYINAVYVNGYRKQDAYIVTQVPYEPNRQQFWKMIESTQASSIVLLGNVPASDQYWPTVINKKFDFNNELNVTLVGEDRLPGGHITVRTFQMWPSELVVRQLHLACTTGGLPTSQDLIELHQQATGSSGSHPALVVQCLDGVQLSGLFCAADFIFERIKEEQQIDVFLACQKVRANRPQFIIDYDQYLFLHQVALAYLQSFDQYANFK